MDPIDLVLTLIPSLSEEEKNQVRELLGYDLPAPCRKNGHKFKYHDKLEPDWWRKWKEGDKYQEGIRYICEKCGKIKLV